MKPRYVSELVEGSSIDATLVVRAKEMRAARNGDAYLSLHLADRSGSIPGVYFRPSAAAVAVPVGAVARVTGVVTMYRGVKRVSLSDMGPALSWDPSDFVPEGVRPLDELVAEFRRLGATVRQPGLRKLLKAVFGDAALMESFCRCPASQTYHHAYLGGLVEHSIAVAEICEAAACRYPDLDRDLVVAAALLHDVGKVDELVCDTAIEYTDPGRLVGHVVLGVQRVTLAGERIKLDPQLLMRLQHAILSHHGELEWGSPKRPSTLEALVLHHADNLDAKAAGFAALLSGAYRAEEAWTDAANLFRRPLYAPKAVEDDRVLLLDEEAQHLRSA